MEIQQNKNIVIEVQNLTKYFKDIHAVDGLNLKIYRGEFVALLGPNGAGKTTLVEMIEGIQPPDSGEVLLLGKPWKGNEHELRKNIGISLQETRFFDKVTVEETLNLFTSFYGLGKARSHEIMKMINLEDKRKSYIVNLSGGQRQRLALGLALINKPEILLLDEPTTGLDPTARREIWYILNDLRKTGTTLILTTHYMEEAEYLCERILIMHKGKFLAEGTLQDLLQTYGKGETIEFAFDKKIDSVKLNKLPGMQKIVWEEENRKGEMQVKDIVAAMHPLMELLENERINLLEFESRKMTLDDLFISMTGRHLEDE